MITMLLITAIPLVFQNTDAYYYTVQVDEKGTWTLKSWDIPTANSGAGRSLVMGKDGPIWFTEYDANKIGWISSSNADPADITVPTRNKPWDTGPFDIAIDSEGDVWFSEHKNGKIARYNLGGNTFDEWDNPKVSQGKKFIPTRISIDGNDNIWYIDASEPGTIGRFDSSKEIFKEWKVPTGLPVLYNPLPPDSKKLWDIVADQKGLIWYTLENMNRIGYFDPLSEMFSNWYVPTSNSGPHAIAVDNEGNIWFTESGSHRLARFNPAKQTFSEWSMKAGSYDFITIDKSGMIWTSTSNSIIGFDPSSETFNEWTVEGIPDGGVWYSYFTFCCWS